MRKEAVGVRLAEQRVNRERRPRQAVFARALHGVLLMTTALCIGCGNHRLSKLGAEFDGLTDAQKQVALALMTGEKCPCGCGMTLERCRRDDPKCSTSRAVAHWIRSYMERGKPATEIQTLPRGAGQEFLNKTVVSIPDAGAPTKGSAAAKLTIVEFADFQCPYCAEAAGVVRAVLSRFDKDVRLVFKQYPLSMHRNSDLAARAALAAGAQGKFWEMHDRLFQNFRSISKHNILQWAAVLQLDQSRFEGDLRSEELEATIKREAEEAKALGVEGTPTIFINGRRLEGPITTTVMMFALSAERNRIRVTAGMDGL